jgi:hypothetical protein
LERPFYEDENISMLWKTQYGVQKQSGIDDTAQPPSSLWKQLPEIGMRHAHSAQHLPHVQRFRPLKSCVV